MKFLADCAKDAFDKHLNAAFYWNSRMESEPRWDYIHVYDAWMKPKNPK